VRCPYCVSEINDQAWVCPVCRHDLYLLKPLLTRIELLEKQLAEQQGELDKGRQPLEGGQVIPATPPAEAYVMPSFSGWLTYWLLPLVLLIAAHGLITVVYDLNTLYLRIVSLLIPVPFGLLLVTREKRSGWLLLVMAVSLAVLAVLAMSALTALVDGTTVMPVGLREWREFAEYAASIALSYAASMIVGRMARSKMRSQLQPQAGLALALAHLVSRSVDQAEQVNSVAKRFSDIGGTLSAFAATAASVYAGLQGVIGK